MKRCQLLTLPLALSLLALPACDKKETKTDDKKVEKQPADNRGEDRAAKAKLVVDEESEEPDAEEPDEEPD